MRAVANVVFVVACAGQGHAVHRSAAQTQSISYVEQVPSNSLEYNPTSADTLVEKDQSYGQSRSLGAVKAKWYRRFGALGALRAFAIMSLTTPPQLGWNHAGHGHSLVTNNFKVKLAAKRALAIMQITENSDVTHGYAGNVPGSAAVEDLTCFECNLERRIELRKSQAGLPTVWGAVGPSLRLIEVNTLNDTISFNDLLNATVNKYDPYRYCVLAWFQGVESKGKLPWDIQTRINYPIVEKVLLSARYGPEVVIIIVNVKKDEYKDNPDCVYRTNPLINVASLPTLLRFDLKDRIKGNVFEDAKKREVNLKNVFVKGRLTASNITEESLDVFIA